MVRLVALLSTVCGVAGATSCADEASCSYNGDCVAGQCVCDPEWHGVQCELLSLLPMSPSSGLYSEDSAKSSWGSSALQDDDGQWHMWASVFTNSCGVLQWTTNSRIVHATATSAEGPYTVQEVVVPLWAHGVKVTRAPTGEYVMAYIHVPISPENTTFPSVCENGTVVQQSPYQTNGGPDRMRSYLSWATSPNGPWSEPVALEEMFTGVPWGDADHNLVFTINDDGSVNGLMRRCCDPSNATAWVSWIYTVHADDWRNASTWSVGASPTFGADLPVHGYEDPHIWMDRRRPGVYHAVLHNMLYSNHHPEVGLHAYSDDFGYSWTSTGIAFTWNVTQTDGSTLACKKRERPTILLSDEGLPSHLASACMYLDDEAGTSRSIVQPIGMWPSMPAPSPTTLV